MAAVEEPQVAAIVSRLVEEFDVDEQARRRAVRERTTTNFIHHATQLKIDLFTAGGTPARRAAASSTPEDYNRPRASSTYTRRKIFCCRSCVGIDKEAAFPTASGGISSVSFEFRVRLLDRGYIVINAPALGVEDSLARACEEA